jgi:hypothetical protein
MRDRFHRPVARYSPAAASKQPARQTGGPHTVSIDPAPAATSTDQHPRGQNVSRTEALAARTPTRPEDVVIDPKELADRYVAVWIEPDAERRRKGITQLRAEDGVHILEPPQEVRETAATLGMTPTLKARGHDALEVRVTRSYQQFIAPGSSSSGPGTTPPAWTTSSSSTGRWCAPAMARWRASAWRSLFWTMTAGSGSTTSSSRDEGERVLAGGPALEELLAAQVTWPIPAA